MQGTINRIKMKATTLTFSLWKTVRSATVVFHCNAIVAGNAVHQVFFDVVCVSEFSEDFRARQFTCQREHSSACMPGTLVCLLCSGRTFVKSEKIYSIVSKGYFWIGLGDHRFFFLLERPLTGNVRLGLLQCQVWRVEQRDALCRVQHFQTWIHTTN